MNGAFATRADIGGAFGRQEGSRSFELQLVTYGITVFANTYLYAVNHCDI